MLRPLQREEQQERRKRHRFPLQRELRYKVLERENVIAMGVGETLNIGSGGLAFRADQPLKVGCFIELSISWPVLLEQDCPMRVVIFGRVLRSDRSGCACTLDKYEFRTQARAPQAVPRVRADGMLQRWAEAVRREEGVKLRVHA